MLRLFFWINLWKNFDHFGIWNQRFLFLSIISEQRLKETLLTTYYYAVEEVDSKLFLGLGFSLH